MRIGIAWVVVGAAVVAAPGERLPAQTATVHLNPVIAKLARGETVFGLINQGDLSLANAREIARAPVDFVYADMEHSPLDFVGLNLFLLGMTDKAEILKKGNLQPNVALMARFPPEADQSAWVVKQALDIGLMGVIFNGVDSTEQAVAAVRSMRYPKLKGAPLPGAGRAARLRARQRLLGVGAQPGGIRAPCRRVAAQPGRRSAGGGDDRVGRGAGARGSRSPPCPASARCSWAPGPTCRARSASRSRRRSWRPRSRRSSRRARHATWPARSRRTRPPTSRAV